MKKFVRLIAGAALAVVATSAASAAGRAYSPAMSCASLQGLVARNGAIVVNTTPRVYDRYVSDARYCERTQETRAEWVPSSDQPDCFIGYVCEEHNRGNSNR